MEALTTTACLEGVQADDVVATTKGNDLWLNASALTLGHLNIWLPFSMKVLVSTTGKGFDANKPVRELFSRISFLFIY